MIVKKARKSHAMLAGLLGILIATAALADEPRSAGTRAVPAVFPFFDGFESGTLGSHWDSTGSGNFRTVVASTNTPFEGTFHVLMDTSAGGARNELTLAIDLTGQVDVELSFWHKEFSDEDHVMPDTFTGSSNIDGVAISGDGTNWHKVQGLVAADGVSGNWRQFVVDIDSAAAAATIPLDENFLIRFNHFDDTSITSDGFAFDNISVAPETLPAPFPFEETFESGALGLHWESTGTGNFRTQITAANSPHGGTRHLTMDTTSGGARNELTLFVDLSGQNDAELRFWHKEFSDEDNVMPASFTNGSDGDGVAISEDGVTWHKVQGLVAAHGVSNTWTEYAVDLVAAANAAGIAFNSAFQIRFNHYDDSPITTDGFAFDDITIDSVIDDAAFPFFEDFESGELSKSWTSTGTGNFRTQVTSSHAPYAGTYHVTMDTSASAARNELTLFIDMSATTQAALKFRHKEFSDEDHAMPTSFSSGSNSDGVAISDDGITWRNVQGLIASDGISNNWTEFTVDLDAAAAAASMVFGERFQIRFNHYDDLSITTDGFAFDNIVVYEPGSGPLKAIVPTPPDGSIDQSLSVDLEWTNGGGATSYDVYFGTSPAPGSGEFQGNQVGRLFDPGLLVTGQTYYWRIDPISPGGKTAGDVWSFTTALVAPLPAINPSPSNGAVDQSTSVNLSWTDGGGANSYDVYFGTDSTPDATEFVASPTEPTYDPGTLVAGTTYYWRIDSVNAGGLTTGDVWSFTTQIVPLSDTWVDSAHVGVENGTQANPFNTIAEGLQYLLDGGTLHIVAGDYAETPTITQSAEFVAEGGVVRIGTNPRPAFRMTRRGNPDTVTNGDSETVWYPWSPSILASLFAATDGDSALATSLTYEPALPYASAADGLRTLEPTGTIALRLFSAEPLNPETLWAEVPEMMRETTSVTWLAVDDAGRDVWVLITPHHAWPPGSLQMRAGGMNVAGERVTSNEFDFSVTAQSTSVSERAAVVVAKDAPTHRAGVGPVLSIEPRAAFAETQRVWLPLPPNAEARHLHLKYLKTNGPDAGWHDARDVAGFLALPGPELVHGTGGTYLVYEVRHAGIVQLGSVPAGVDSATREPTGSMR